MDRHVNESFLRMRDKLIERKNKKELYGKLSSLGMCIGLLPVISLFTLKDFTLTTLLEMLANPLFLAGILVLALSMGVYKVYYEKEKGKYDALREELMEKITLKNEFCSCWTPCDCIEDFLRESKVEYGINLYWK